jgi:hypothetical protein
MRYARQPQHDFENISLVAEAEIDELLRHSRSVQAEMKRRTDGGALAEYELEKKRASRKGKNRAKAKINAGKSSLMLPQLSIGSSKTGRQTVQKVHQPSHKQPSPKTGSLGHDQKFQCRDDIFALLDANQAEEDSLYASMQETSDEQQLAQLQKRIDQIRSQSSTQLLSMLKVYDPKASAPSPADIEAGVSTADSLCQFQTLGDLGCTSASAASISRGKAASRKRLPRKKKSPVASLNTEVPMAPDEEWSSTNVTDQSAGAVSAAEEYLFDRSDGYVAYPTSHEDLQNAVDESQTPIGQLNSHRPVTRSGIGIDRGLSGIHDDHVAAIDTDFPSLRVYERESQADAKYWSNTVKGGGSKSEANGGSTVKFSESSGGGGGKKYVPTPHPQPPGAAGGFAADTGV